MTTRLIQSVLPTLPNLILVIGFPPEDQVVSDLGSNSSDVFDLDKLDMSAELEPPPSGVVAVIARTTTDLRRAASLAGVLPKADHIVIGVVEWPIHRSPPLPIVATRWPRMHSLQAHTGPTGHWLVEAHFYRAISTGEFLAAIIRGLDGQRMQTLASPRIALAGRGAAHWRPGDPGVLPADVQGYLGAPGEFLSTDLVVRTVGAEPPLWSDKRVTVVDRPDVGQASWEKLGSPGGMADVMSTMRILGDVDSVPPIDERSVNPGGFICSPEHGIGKINRVEGRWTVHIDGQSITQFHPSGVVTDAEIAKLRQLRALNVQDIRFTGPYAAVRLLAGLAAAGVPLSAAHLPPWAQALGADLVELITGIDESDLADDLLREEYSVRLRRLAMRAHSTRARWRNVTAAAGLATDIEPKVSVILCTRRVEFLEFAMRQVSRQRHVELELVLTLHGVAADHPVVESALAAFDRPVTVVEVPSSVPFGVALNRGIRQASGQYIAKWDDDDWYSPEFLADMLLAHSYSGADLVGCLGQLIYLERIDLTVLHRGGESERESRHISGGTLVMPRHVFDDVGGFRPVWRHVDTGLLRTIEAAGGRIYRTHGLGYMRQRRAEGHTWEQPVTTWLRGSTRQWRGIRPNALIEADGIKAAEIFDGKENTRDA